MKNEVVVPGPSDEALFLFSKASRCPFSAVPAPSDKALFLLLFIITLVSKACRPKEKTFFFLEVQKEYFATWKKGYVSVSS